MIDSGYRFLIYFPKAFLYGVPAILLFRCPRTSPALVWSLPPPPQVPPRHKWQGRSSLKKEKKRSRTTVNNFFAIAQITARQQPTRFQKKCVCAHRAPQKIHTRHLSSRWHYTGGAPAVDAPPLATAAAASFAIRMISIRSVCCSTSSAVVAA
jgi:hypothetical protein